MKTIAIVLLTLFCTNAFAAKLDWRRLSGKYDYVACQDDGESVWPPKREEFYVWIFEPVGKPWENTLHMNLLRREYSPMALAHTMYGIDEGVHERRNRETNVLEGIQKNYTDEVGLHGTYTWDYLTSSGFRVWGRSAIELRLSEDGNTLYYEMMVAHRDQPERRERCMMKRQAR